MCFIFSRLFLTCPAFANRCCGVYTNKQRNLDILEIGKSVSCCKLLDEWIPPGAGQFVDFLAQSECCHRTGSIGSNKQDRLPTGIHTFRNQPPPPEKKKKNKYGRFEKWFDYARRGSKESGNLSLDQPPSSSLVTLSSPLPAEPK